MRHARLLLAIAALMLLVAPATALAQQEDPLAEVIAVINANPDDTGIACYPIGDPEAGYFRNAEDTFPLASTGKILVLAEFARQVVAGDLDPDETVPLDAIAAYYLPVSDGGSHELWLNTLDANAETATLRQIAEGMIVFSSNANTDYLLNRLGPDGFPDLYAAFDVADPGIINGILGFTLLLYNHETGIVVPEALTAETYPAENDRLAALFIDDSDWRADAIAAWADIAVNQDAIPENANSVISEYINTYGWQATPRDFADIMAAVYAGDVPGGEDAAALMRDILDWPMDFPGISDLFETAGTKGGSYSSGVLTAAYYADPVEGDPLVLTVFYRNLDPEVYTEWSQTFAQQNLEVAILVEGCDVLNDWLEPVE